MACKNPYYKMLSFFIDMVGWSTVDEFSEEHMQESPTFSNIGKITGLARLGRRLSAHLQLWG